MGFVASERTQIPPSQVLIQKTKSGDGSSAEEFAGLVGAGFQVEEGAVAFVDFQGWSGDPLHQVGRAFQVELLVGMPGDQE